MNIQKYVDFARDFINDKAVFKENLLNLGFVERAAIWKTLDVAEKVLTSKEGRKANLRQSLLDDAESQGTPTEKGGQMIEDKESGFKVIRERREGKLPEIKPLIALLKKKEIPVVKAFDEVKELVPSPSKIEYLVQTGVLTQEEVDACKKVTFALRVDAPEAFDLLTE
jgi:hypothetical protein